MTIKLSTDTHKNILAIRVWDTISQDSIDRIVKNEINFWNSQEWRVRLFGRLKRS